VALQLGVTHWFYLYVTWFAPLALVALLGRHRSPPPEESAPEAAARPIGERSPVPA